jgi:hypothetical protein
VPQTGSIDRIFPSHFSFGRGVDATSACGRFPATCHGMFVGNLQPYNVYVPASAPPAAGWGMTLQLHPSGGNYNEWMDSRYQSEIGDRGAGSVVLTSGARDPDGDFTDASEADVFEAWADAARHYPLDPTRAAVTGYSMGGGGTYRLMERWPDLFGRGFAVAAVPYEGGSQGQWITSMRNVPLLTWISLADEGSPVVFQANQISALESSGVRFAFDQFVEGDHVTLATNDDYGPAADWLGDARVDTDPVRVTFVVDTPNDFPDEGVAADHAYWLSDLTVRSPATDPAGQVDARSGGFGLADPTVVPPGPIPTAGTLWDGHKGPMPYLQTAQSWSAPQPVPPVDELTIDATNLSGITVDAQRAHLTCAGTLNVTSDGPVTVVVPSCHATLSFPAGTNTRRIGGQ